MPDEKIGMNLPLVRPDGMRKDPRVDGEKRPGMNLFMCIPPDHMREDEPSTVSPYLLMEVSRGFNSVAPFKPCLYVGITDDLGHTVTLPCFDVRYDNGKVVVMAHRTGRSEK